MIDGRFAEYLDRLARLTPDTLPQLAGLLADEVRFTDPFHDVRGREAVRVVFARALADVADSRFTVLRAHADGDTCLVKWTFEGRLRALHGRPWRLTGMSEIRLDKDGHVILHADYWDAAGEFYTLLPMIGPMMRWLRSRVARAGRRR